MTTEQILPGTGRGTMRSMVEGQPQAMSLPGHPSVTAMRRHLPVPGRTFSADVVSTSPTSARFGS